MFHGWGSGHQYRFGSGKLTEVGTPYALPESLDEDFALDYGDLSIHEWATDPDQNLAYASYDAGGLRVVSFNSEGIKEQGHYIDGAGSNFWGVEQFTSGGQRLIAASDRDYGLYIFRYTGPDAPPDSCALRAAAARGPVDAARGEGRHEAAHRVAVIGQPQPAQAASPASSRSACASTEASRVQVTLQGRLTRRSGAPRQPAAAGPDVAVQRPRQPDADGHAPPQQSRSAGVCAVSGGCRRG